MTSISSSAWFKSVEVSDRRQIYQYSKIPQEPQVWSNFHVRVCIFPGDNKRTEIYAKTSDLDRYFKIIEVAQKHLSKGDQYYFDSSYAPFSKDSNGLCTVEAVKKVCDRMSRIFFEKTFLEQNLGHIEGYKTQEECLKNIRDALTVLKEVDPAISEIQEELDSVLFS